MTKENMTILGAMVVSILSTMCCVPALIFLVFGISTASLSFLSSFEIVRIPLGMISVVLFGFWIYFKNKKMVCDCQKIARFKLAVLSGSLFMTILVLLFYPEFLVGFFE